MWDIDNNHLNGIAMQLVFLGLYITVFMVLTGIILNVIQKKIRIHSEITNFLLGLAGLGAAYVWFQITFM